MSDDMEIIPADDPKRLKLGWTVTELPGKCFGNWDGKVVTWDEWGRAMDLYGFLVDEKAEQIKDKDGNFMLSKDFPMEKK